MTILLVDDDRDLVDLLEFSLRRAGLMSVAAFDAPSALRVLGEQPPELVVLDLLLGAWDGFGLLEEIRRRSRVPILVLSGKQAEDDKVRALDLGADDYVTKPFGHRELTARIRAHLRRGDGGGPAPASPDSMTTGPLALDLARRIATKNGDPLHLTVIEFRLLHELMARAGTVVPTKTLLWNVWGYDDAPGTDVLRVTLHRLRRKLEDDPGRPKLVHTVPGVGVVLWPEGKGLEQPAAPAPE